MAIEAWPAALGAQSTGAGLVHQPPGPRPLQGRPRVRTPSFATYPWEPCPLSWPGRCGCPDPGWWAIDPTPLLGSEVTRTQSPTQGPGSLFPSSSRGLWVTAFCRVGPWLGTDTAVPYSPLREPRNPASSLAWGPQGLCLPRGGPMFHPQPGLAATAIHLTLLTLG